VLEGSIAIVEKYDKSRLQKGPFEYIKKEGPKIQIHSVASDKKEANAIRKIAEKALPSRRVLILVPYRGFVPAIASELRKAGIAFASPPTIPGEGLPVIAMLFQWVSNPNDNIALRICLEHFMNNPSSGIPTSRSRTTAKKEARNTAFEVLSKLWQPVLSGRQPSLWEALLSLKKEEKIISLVKEALKRILEFAKGDDPGHLAQQAIAFLRPWSKSLHFLKEVDAWVSALTEQVNDTQSGNVRIMTLQGAKGLEADVVCVVGMEEGTLPRHSSLGEQLAEDARLFYVSATRAVEELHIFHARKRSSAVLFRQIYRKGRPPDLKPSRFLVDLGKAHSGKTFHPTV